MGRECQAGAGMHPMQRTTQPACSPVAQTALYSIATAGCLGAARQGSTALQGASVASAPGPSPGGCTGWRVRTQPAGAAAGAPAVCVRSWRPLRRSPSCRCHSRVALPAAAGAHAAQRAAYESARAAVRPLLVPPPPPNRHAPCASPAAATAAALPAVASQCPLRERALTTSALPRRNLAMPPPPAAGGADDEPSQLPDAPGGVLLPRPAGCACGGESRADAVLSIRSNRGGV